MSDTSEAFAALNEVVTITRNLEGYKTEFLPLLAGKLLEHVQQTAAAGTSPDGTPWPSTKAGARALPNAADKVSVVVVGSRIVMRVQGHEARHNYGQSRGGVVRRVIFSGRDDVSVFMPIVEKTLNDWLMKDGTLG